MKEIDIVSTCRLLGASKTIYKLHKLDNKRLCVSLIYSAFIV